MIEFNAGIGDFSYKYDEQTAKRYANLASIITCEKYSPRYGVRALIQQIDSLNRKLAIPKDLRGEEILSETLNKDIEDVVLGALNDKCTLTNPSQPTADEVKKIILDVFGM